MPKGRRDSQLVEETSRGESSGGGGPLKKGPWTSTEDAILVDYVNKHGEGNWNAVQKHSGLSRCGKSCRLRWANHLRPDLKKGAFTPEEEQRIIELHAKMGNKWARMAAELPGRTDNEIKNFWNTRIKRLQRAGLPIYPEEVCLQVLNGTRESPNMDRLLDSETHGHDVLQAETFDIPDVQFKSLDFNRGFLPYSSMFVDLPMSIRKECANTSSGCSFVLPTIPPCKRLRESETLVSGVDTNTSSGVLAFDQSMSYAQGKSGQPFGSSSYYSDLSPSDQMLLLSVLPGSHALSNGNSSSSEPTSRAMKLELPSLQYPNTQQNSWGTPTSPLPSLESIDTFIQSPPTEQTQSDCPSPRSSGLLEAVIYQSHGVRSPKKNLFEHSLDTIAVPGDIRENSPLNPCATELGAHGDPNSLLGHSTASVFSDYTAISGISSEEFQTVETKPGYDRNPESVYHLMQSVEKTENLDVLDYSRSDALIDSGWFGHSTGHEKDRSIPRDTIGALLGDDFNIDY